MRLRSIAALCVTVGALSAGAFVVSRNERSKKVAWILWADLKNLAKAQIAYYADNATYGRDLSHLYYATHGAVVRITSATDTSWSAEATHPQSGRAARIDYVQPRHATRAQIGAARVAALQTLSAQLARDGGIAAR